MLGNFSKVKLYILSAVAGVCLSSPSFADYKKNYVGEMETYTAVYEDTLVHLARKHGLGFVEVRAANPDLDPWIPGKDAEVVLPKRHLLPDVPRQGLVINLPEMRVYGFINGDAAPVTYPLGIGREGLDTPTGKTSIVRKKEGPTWRPTDRMRKEDPKLPAVVPPGPDNPLGTHALYLGWSQYAIHGTSRPYGIGRRVSSGCIRMYPENIIEFFEQVPVGTKVNVVNQPIKVAWIGNELYLEAHPAMEQAIKMEETGAVEHQSLDDDDMALILDRAGMYQDRLNWPRIRAAVRERRGYPIRIARHFDEINEEQVEENTNDDLIIIPAKKPTDEIEEAEKTEEAEVEIKEGDTTITVQPDVVIVEAQNILIDDGYNSNE